MPRARTIRGKSTAVSGVRRSHASGDLACIGAQIGPQQCLRNFNQMSDGEGCLLEDGENVKGGRNYVTVTLDQLSQALLVAGAEASRKTELA